MELLWKALQAVLGAAVVGLGGVALLVAGVALWLLPGAWLLRRLGRRWANPALSFSSAAAAVQIGVMLFVLPAPLLVAALSVAAPGLERTRGFVLALCAFALSTTAIGVRQCVRAPGGAPLPWPRVFALSLLLSLLLSCLHAVLALLLFVLRPVTPL